MNAVVAALLAVVLAQPATMPSPEEFRQRMEELNRRAREGRSESEDRAAMQAEIDRLKTENAQLRRELADLRGRLASSSVSPPAARPESTAATPVDLSTSVSATLLDKLYLPPDYSDPRDFDPRAYVVLRVRLQNGTGQDLRGTQGWVVCSDLFGKEQLRIRAVIDKPIPRGGSIEDNVAVEYSAFDDEDQWLRNTETRSLRIRFVVAAIMTADGRVVKVGE